MACLDMYNSEHKMGHHHHHNHNHHLHHHNSHLMASPRISFSNDFVDAQQAMRQEIMRSSRSSSESVPAVSSDFEFSVTNYSMMSGADELFFKGRLLPYKETNVVSSNKDGNTTSSSSSSKRPVTTLRDELQHGDSDVTSRPTKGSSWKSLLGLKRAHGGSNSKKPEKSDGPRTLTMLGHDEAHVSKTSQDWLNEDGEIGV